VAFKIIWSPQAASNLEGICDYISKDSEYYATLFINILKKLAKKQAFEMTPPKERHLVDREVAGVANPFLLKE
jgi:hypothetical protein